jgi:hypothetical protein
MVYSKHYHTNIQEIGTKVTAGNNMTMQCTLKGEYVGYLQSEGRQVRVNLKDVVYVPRVKRELNISYTMSKIPRLVETQKVRDYPLEEITKNLTTNLSMVIINCMQQISNQSAHIIL